jgi:uncharacterized damage-inducible protein DinB
MVEKLEIDSIALDAVRIRVTKVLPAQIRTCLEQLTDEQVWWRPNDKSNSIGNLTLHVCGAVMHFLCRGVGGHEYQRNRPTEFATKQMPKEQLLKVLDEMVVAAEQTFANLDASRLSEPSTEPAYYSTIFEDLFGIAIHVAVHTGQIVYITKALREGAVNELWMETHRSLGTWKT